MSVTYSLVVCVSETIVRVLCGLGKDRRLPRCCSRSDTQAAGREHSRRPPAHSHADAQGARQRHGLCGLQRAAGGASCPRGAVSAGKGEPLPTAVQGGGTKGAPVPRSGRTVGRAVDLLEGRAWLISGRGWSGVSFRPQVWPSQRPLSRSFPAVWRPAGAAGKEAPFTVQSTVGQFPRTLASGTESPCL